MISHIVSYWRYQFQPNQSEGTNIEEFLDLLKDFDLDFSPGKSGGLRILSYSLGSLPA